MDNKVVYFHRTKEELPRVYYVGCGTKERAYDFRKSQRSKEWNKIHNELDTEVVIYHADLSKEEAHKMEIDLIAFFGRQCTGEGFLVNKAIGGWGSKGWIPSEETKAKMSKAHKGKKLLSESTRRKLSMCRQGEKSPVSKLTEKDVREIIYQLKFNYHWGIVVGLAKQYSVKKQTISDIKNKINWKHIDWNTILKKD